MRILLDESLPKRLKKHFLGHMIKTVADMKWHGKKNGELMALIKGKFDIFITPDQRYDDSIVLIPELLKALKQPIVKTINVIGS